MEVVSADTTRTDGYAHGDSALARTTTGTALNERRAMHRAVRNAANAPEQRLVQGQARTLSVGETPRAPTSVAHDRRQVDDFVEDSRKRQERVRAQVRAHRRALHRRDHRRRRRTERIERCRAAVEVGRKDRMGREATRRCVRTKHAINNVRYAGGPRPATADRRRDTMAAGSPSGRSPESNQGIGGWCGSCPRVRSKVCPEFLRPVGPLGANHRGATPARHERSPRMRARRQGAQRPNPEDNEEMS